MCFALSIEAGRPKKKVSLVTSAATHRKPSKERRLSAHAAPDDKPAADS
jgi:hypothetical protein